MALSSSPADPPSSTNTTSTTAPTTTTPRLFTAAPAPSRGPRPPPTSSPFPQPQSQFHRLPSQPPPQPHQPLFTTQPFSNLAPRGGGVPAAAAVANRGILYPVASSGRGFLPKAIRAQPADHTVTIANHGGFPSRPLVGAPYAHTVRAFGFPPHSDPHGHLIRPTHLQPTFLGSTGGGGVMSGAVKGVPVSTHQKVAPSQPSLSDSNGYKDQRGRSRDDSFATVRDRKVRICEGSSLYSLCRSWLRNGFPDEIQPQYVDGTKLLPKPSPTPVADASVKKEGDKEEEEEKSIENLSPKDLLQRHVKRAKRVRSRLREERSQRIARYKTRLALLLPPLVEQQQFRNDTAASN